MSNYSSNEIEMADHLSPLSQLNEQYATMTKSQRKIANYINAHENEVLSASITVLAKKIGTTPSSITRFCQFLHFKGFSDFKFYLESELISPSLPKTRILKTDGVADIKGKFYTLYTKALADTTLNLDNLSVQLAVKVLTEARRVYIYALGSSGSSANSIYQLLLQAGIPCNYFVDQQLALLSCGHLKKGDAAFVINYSGTSSVIMDILLLAKQNGASTIALTSNLQSNVGRTADIALCYSTLVEDDLRYLHIARMCELAIIGLLQAVIINNASEPIIKNINYSKMSIEKTRGK